MILPIIIILGFIVLLVSPVGDLAIAGIVNNNELVFTFLILLTFKLLNRRIDTIVEKTDERVKDNFGLIFLFFTGLILWFARGRSWWGEKPPLLLIGGVSWALMLIPTYIAISGLRSKVYEESEKV